MQFSGDIRGLCAAPQADCVLLAGSQVPGNDWQMVRVSLAEKRVVESICRASHTDATVSDVRVLSAAHIALALYKQEKGSIAHSVRLLVRQSNNTWRVAHELRFDSTSGDKVYSPRLCIFRDLLLCAARYPSIRLVALEVTNDSHLQQIGCLKFDSPLLDLGAFVSASGDQQLVATAHADCTVRLLRHVEAIAAAARSTFALEECSRVITNTKFNRIISTAVGLLLQPVSPEKTVRLCRINGTHLEEPIPQPQLGSLDIWCGCSAGRNVFIYDRESKSLLTIDT